MDRFCNDIRTITFRQAAHELRAYEDCQIFGADISAWNSVQRTRRWTWKTIRPWVIAGYLTPPCDDWLDLGLALSLQIGAQWQELLAESME